MTIAPDARIAVYLVPPADARADSAWLIQGDAPAPGAGPVARFQSSASSPGHPAGCVCCLPRGPVAEALSRLFLARARGEVAYFRLVLALPHNAAGATAIRDALAQDSLLAGRFRLVSD
ncbi:MAG: hypothetical protein EXR05_03775 [Acetobacteraceae bacterium]|nr:hypothetical protein [Acetobacteraceae bacterium]